MRRPTADLPRILTRQLRALTLEQAARLGCARDQSNLRRVVRPLVESGLLAVLSLTALDDSPGPGPLLSWRPGEPEPDFGPALWAAEKRGRVAETRSRRVLVATRRCGNRFGVSRTGTLAKPLQAAHDLMCSEVLVRLYESDPAEAEGWCGEDALCYRLAGKVPDAVILSGRRVVKVVEAVSPSYRAEKLAALWRGAARKGVALELW